MKNLELSQLRKYRIKASDAELGTVDDVLYDPNRHQIRYIVADTMKWFPGRKVLLRPDACERLDHDNMTIEFSLSAEQIKNAPSLDLQDTLTRPYEEQLHHYYGWSPYWNFAPLAGPWFPYPEYDLKEQIKREPNSIHQKWHDLYKKRTSEGKNLVSGYETLGLKLHSSDDEEFGEVENLMIDCESWQILDLVFSSRRWLPGGKLITCPPNFVTDLDLVSKKIHVELSYDQMMHAPDYVYENYGKDYQTAVGQHYIEGGDPVEQQKAHVG